MSFTSWNVRSSSFHNGWQIFLSWILRNASTVRNITIGNITETGFSLAVFWITLLECAKQIQITIEDNKRKQSSFFYSQNRIFCLVVNLQWQCTHTFFFPQLNSLFSNIKHLKVFSNTFNNADPTTRDNTRETEFKNKS